MEEPLLAWCTYRVDKVKLLEWHLIGRQPQSVNRLFSVVYTCHQASCNYEKSYICILKLCYELVTIILSVILRVILPSGRQASVLAVISTFLAIGIIIYQLIAVNMTKSVDRDRPLGIETFSLGFSTILFSFGGASAFPTLQNDMENRNEWWKSVTIAFVGQSTI